jgi:predicted RNase H-like HicB family nuclease
MSVRFILSAYVEKAMAQALYDKLDDGTFAGRIPSCKGVVAFGVTLRKCEEELRSTLEDWILVGLKLGHRMPILGGVNLNRELKHERVVPCKLRMMIREVESILGRRVTFDEWKSLR